VCATSAFVAGMERRWQRGDGEDFLTFFFRLGYIFCRFFPCGETLAWGSLARAGGH
jgi:hypothetical protein